MTNLNFLFAAYTAVWVLLFLYILMVARRNRALQKELEELRQLLERRNRWWQIAFAERQAKEGDHLVDPIFFRVKVESMSGLCARAEA